MFGTIFIIVALLVLGGVTFACVKYFRDPTGRKIAFGILGVMAGLLIYALVQHLRGL